MNDKVKPPRRSTTLPAKHWRHPMTHDPKLVEALAQLICHQTMSGEAPVGCRDCERTAREFLAAHRLVQLPERASGRQAEYTGPMDDAPTWGKGWHHPFAETPTGRTRPYWTIYGEPEDSPTEEVPDA